jgi:hypothetical protein
MDSTRTPFPARVAEKIFHTTDRKSSMDFAAEEADLMSQLRTFGAAEPTLLDHVIVAHRRTLALFSLFFRALAEDEGSRSAIQAAGYSLAVDLKMHSQVK